MQLSRELSERIFLITTDEDLRAWLLEVETSVGGLRWEDLGGLDSNPHSVEVASDPAAALVERVTNSIDAVLDLMALSRDETAPSPHEGARRWYNVPPNGVSALTVSERQGLADLIRVSNYESGSADQPTIVIQDKGTGQHPDNFKETLLSLMKSNKKSKYHQIGVYNAGSAATYAFCPYTLIVARLAPQLLNGMPDEIGAVVVRYNELDPDRFKSGTYEYCTDVSAQILRLDLPDGELPSLTWGTYVKHIRYELSSYARSAHEPKASLHHLFHAALPDPPLPFWVEERRTDRFKWAQGVGERRVVSGLLARLRRPGIADYNDERPINLGPSEGHVVLRYFVLNEGQDPEAFATAQQGLAFVLNGQRQGTKDRYWVKRNTGLNYLWRRLLVIVDCNALTSSARRNVFASTRESNKDSQLVRLILSRAIDELKGDDQLAALDEQARQQTLQLATKSTSEKVKRQLANRIAHMVKGPTRGKAGGGAAVRPPRPPGPPPLPRDIDDSDMLDIPDTLEILHDPVRIQPGRTAPLRLLINAKNDFLPKYAQALTVVVGSELHGTVRLRSKGRVVGGQVRLTLEADAQAPLDVSDLQVALLEPSLSLLLTAKGKVEVVEPPQPKEPQPTGGSPDVEINWVGREAWTEFLPVWDEDTVGECNIEHKDLTDPKAITRVEWTLNRAFKPYEDILGAKKVGADALKTFQDAYEFPICWGLFMQALAEHEKSELADDGGSPCGIPDSYLRGERSRLARAVLMALKPELAASMDAQD